MHITIEEENMSMQLIEVGIAKHLLEVKQTELQQQAIDLVILLLRKGCEFVVVYVGHVVKLQR